MKINLLKGIAITALLFSYSNNFVVATHTENHNETQQTNINETQKTQLTGKYAQAAIINNTVIKYFAAIVGRLNCHVLSTIKDKNKKKSIKQSFDANRDQYIKTITNIINDKEIVSDNSLRSIIDKNAQKIAKELKTIKDVDSAAKFYATMEKYYASEIADSIAINDDDLNIQKTILQSLKSVVNYMIRSYGMPTQNQDTLEGRYHTALQHALEVGMFELIENICKAFKGKGHIAYNIFANNEEDKLVRFKQLQEELSAKTKTMNSAIHNLAAMAQISSYESLTAFEKHITIDYNTIKAEQSITKIKTVEFDEQEARKSANRLTAEESAFTLSQKYYSTNKKAIFSTITPSKDAAKLENFSEKEHLQMISSNNSAYRLGKDGLYVKKSDGSGGEDFFDKSTNTIQSLKKLSTGNKKYINDKLINGWAEKVNVDNQNYVYLYTVKGTKIYLLSDLDTKPAPKKLDRIHQFFTIKNNASGNTIYTLWKKGKRHYESAKESTSLAELSRLEVEQLANGNQSGTQQIAQPDPNVINNGQPASNANGNGQPASNANGNGQPASNVNGNGQPASNVNGNGQPASNVNGNGQPASNANGNGQPASNANGNGQPASGNMTPPPGNMPPPPPPQRSLEDIQNAAESSTHSTAAQKQTGPFNKDNIVKSDEAAIEALNQGKTVCQVKVMDPNEINNIDGDILYFVEDGKKKKILFSQKSFMTYATMVEFNDELGKFEETNPKKINRIDVGKFTKMLTGVKKKTIVQNSGVESKRDPQEKSGQDGDAGSVPGMKTFWPDFAYKLSEDGQELTLSQNGKIATYKLLEGNKQIAKISSDGSQTIVNNAAPKKGQNGVWYAMAKDDEKTVWKTTIANAVKYGTGETPVDLTVEFHKDGKTKIFGKGGTLTYDFKYEKSLYFCKLATEDQFKDRNKVLQEVFQSVSNDITRSMKSTIAIRNEDIADSDEPSSDDEWSD